MASTKVPSVLWNVAQSLDKDDKALARTNIGVNNTLIGSVPEHYFVTGIEADSTGDLSLIPGRPTVSDLSDLAFDDATGVSPYNSSTNKVATVSSVTKRIGDLDGNLNNTEPGSGKTLTAFSQTDGVVSATFGNISITESQISDFGTYSTDSFKTVSDGTNTITASGTTAALNVTGTSPVNVTANASTNTVTVSVPAATPSSSGAGGSAGLMSAADKEKLDTLSSIASVGTDLMLDNGVISVDTTGTIDAASNSGNNFIMGVGTSIEKSISSDLPCKACFAGGSQSHMIGAEDSFLFGNQSTIGALANDARPDGCIVLGNANKVYGGDHNVAIGTAITVDGTTSPAYSFPNNFTLIGYNLSVNKTTMPTDAMHDGCLILGKYNNETTKGPVTSRVRMKN